MPAFSYSTKYQIEHNIRTLYARRRALSRLTLTHEEYIDTFVPVEARQLFRDIAPFKGVTGTIAGKIDLRQFGHGAEAQLYIRGDRRPAPPLVKGHVAQPDAPADVVGRIKTWIENGGDTCCDFGRVSRVFNFLNENYSRAAVRHYWPTIMALCDGNELTETLIPELQTMRTPSSLKPLPPGVIQACRKTASTISTAQLIPKDATPNERGDVTIEVTMVQEYSEEGIGKFYGLA